jgi:hypothetical protein
MDRRILAVAAVAVLSIAGAMGGETRTGYGVTLVSGYDSNPLRVSKEASGPDGTFGQVRLEGQVTHTAASSLTLFADGQAHGRFHGSGTSDADFSSGTVRMGLALSPASLRRLVIGAGGRYTAYRTTYVDRADGEVYEVSSILDPSVTTPIGDRLDHDAAEYFFNLRWKQNEKLKLFLDTRLEETNYVEDYTATTYLEPLDSRATTVEPGASLQLHRAARLIFSVAFTDLDYTEQSALDADGFRVQDETRSYEYTQYRLTLRVTPSDRWNVWAGARSSDRNDRYAGYYDYGSVSSYVSVDRMIGEKAKIRLYTSLSDLNYDNATVSGDLDGQTLDNEVRTVLTRYERDLRERSRWFVEGGLRRADSRDPDFAYDSDWVLGGIRFWR